MVCVKNCYQRLTRRVFSYSAIVNQRLIAFDTIRNKNHDMQLTELFLHPGEIEWEKFRVYLAKILIFLLTLDNAIEKVGLPQFKRKSNRIYYFGEHLIINSISSLIFIQIITVMYAARSLSNRSRKIVSRENFKMCLESEAMEEQTNKEICSLNRNDRVPLQQFSKQRKRKIRIMSKKNQSMISEDTWCDGCQEDKQNIGYGGNNGARIKFSGKSKDYFNPEQISHYESSIISESSPIKTQSIDSQAKQITQKVRLITIDWLFQVSQQIRAPKEVAHNAIEYLDRVCSKKRITKQNYQLHAAVCLYIAFKLDSSSCFKSNVIQELLQKKYTVSQIHQTEKQILVALQFQLHGPTLLLVLNLLINSSKNCNLIRKLMFRDDSQQVFHEMMWILDGYVMENKTNMRSKEKYNVCLTIFFIVMKKHLLIKSKDKISHLIDEQKQSIIYVEKFVELAKEFEKKFQPKKWEQLYLNSTKFIKWMTNECTCQEGANYYHPQLKKFIAQYL